LQAAGFGYGFIVPGEWACVPLPPERTALHRAFKKSVFRQELRQVFEWNQKTVVKKGIQIDSDELLVML
jgi:hypothetical protein